MSTAQPPTTSSVYPDRSTTLIIAGVFQILLGCLCGLMTAMLVAVMWLGPMAPAAKGHAVKTPVTIYPIVFYLLMAVGFTWLGIGLVARRRWAWTLTVVWSWTWLVVGVFAFVMVMFVMEQRAWAAIAEQGKLPPEMIATMRIMTSAVFACIYILLPGLFLLLCHHASVRATCRARDPKIPWTDRCPMPVLALSILLALSIVSMTSLVAYRCVMPLFGVFISGWAGAAVILLIALVLAYLAWGTYRLQRAAWWGTLLLVIVGTVNMVVTFSRTDMMKMYEMMGMPADQLDLIRKIGLIEMMTRWGPWMGLVGGVGWLGYLLFLHRYFVHRLVPE